MAKSSHRSGALETGHDSRGSSPPEALVVSIDGQLLDGAAAAVPVWDRGLLYGDGCFEGLRLYDGRLFRFGDHYARLADSARALQLTLPMTSGELLDRIRAVATANQLSDAHVRVLLTRGSGTPGLDPRRAQKPRVIVLAYPMPPLLGESPISVLTSSVIRKAPRSIPAHVKSLNYLDGILAKQQAAAAGADEAFMLDALGALAEATAANVFVVKSGTVATPTTRAALPGVTRRTVLEVLAREGVEAVERDVQPGELYAAEECFLTGTGAGIVPVGSIDGRELSAPGPVTTLVRERYARAIRAPALTTVLLPG